MPLPEPIERFHPEAFGARAMAFQSSIVRRHKARQTPHKPRESLPSELAVPSFCLTSSEAAKMEAPARSMNRLALDSRPEFRHPEPRAPERQAAREEVLETIRRHHPASAKTGAREDHLCRRNGPVP